MERISSKIDVENFSATNFELWKLKVEDLLIDWNLSDAVDENKFRPQIQL